MRALRGLAARGARAWLWTQGPDSLATGVASDATGVSPAVGGTRPGDVDVRTLVTQAYDAFEREIHAFALHATRDPEAAADVTQEAFLRLMREVSERERPENVRAWLYRVATNLVVNRARRATVADRWRRIVAGPERVVDSPERSLLDRERDATVRAALAEMSKDARTGLLLAANGFSGREIADALGRTELATRSLLCRARTQLRGRLEGFQVEA
jgi:RNA polymerase sigma-70 factor (ECF subfamily)